MRRTQYIVAALVVAGFLIGFNYTKINSYFTTYDSIIGLLFSIIVVLVVVIFRIIDRREMIKNSYNHSDGQNNELRKQVNFLAEQIKEKDKHIHELAIIIKNNG